MRHFGFCSACMPVLVVPSCQLGEFLMYFVSPAALSAFFQPSLLYDHQGRYDHSLPLFPFFLTCYGRYSYAVGVFGIIVVRPYGQGYCQSLIRNRINRLTPLQTR